MSDLPKAEPCPFCGGEATLTRFRNEDDLTINHSDNCAIRDYCGCRYIHCEGQVRPVEKVPSILLKWNRRATPVDPSDVLDKEIGEFQDDARAVMAEALDSVGIPGYRIDGGGCDSGDWRDFTLSEIGQGMGMATEKIEELREILRASVKSAGGIAADDVSDEFLAGLPKEIEALRNRATPAADAKGEL